MASTPIPLKETIAELTKELIPPEKDEKVGFECFKILDEVLTHKQSLGLPAKWNRNYELVRNKHWRKPSSEASLVSANLLFTHRTRTVNMLTDNNPTFNIKKAGETGAEQEDVFDSLLKTCEFWWQDQEQQAVLEKSILNGETYGCAIEKSVFNATLESGLGDVETIVVDPFHFGRYPVECMDIQKCEAVLHYWAMPVREARRRWNDKARYIKSDREYLAELGDSRIEVMGGNKKRPSGYFSTFGNIVKNMVNTADSGKGSKDEVLIVEMWVKDYSRIKQDGMSYDKYPGNIRVITSCNGGETVLQDVSNPSINPDLPEDQAAQTYLWDHYPFSFTQSHTDTSNPYGMCDFEQLEELNLEIDKTLSQVTLVKDKVSRVKILNPKDSGVSNREFTNKPGILNPSSTMTAAGIRYMDAPRIPTDLVEVMNIYKEFFFLVSGTFELEQAQTPGRDVIAYKAIAALLERANTMMRGKIRNYGRMVRERGKMYISHVMNWYTTERWISYEQDGVELTKSIKGTEMVVPMKLMVVSGSTMPVSRLQEREEALMLFDKGAIDVEALLEKIDWPDRRSVVTRLKEGPIGELAEKLTQIGAPPQIIEYMSELGTMEFSEFEKMLEKGELPPFAEVMTPPEEQQQNPMEVAELEEKATNIEKVQAEIMKVQADIMLIQEQVNTEKVQQMVSMAGVEFDREKLVIERAKTVSDIKNEAKTAEASLKKASEKKVQGSYREKGLSSNNKKK